MRAAVELLVEVVEKVAAGVGLEPELRLRARGCGGRRVPPLCAARKRSGVARASRAVWRAAIPTLGNRPVVIVSVQALNRALSEVTIALSS